MSKYFWPAFVAGLAALAWIAAGFAGGSWLTLVMTGVIGVAYLVGAFELRQFRQHTQALDRALEATQQPPETLAGWLQQLPASLRDAVRLRIEGERGVLPGPALTPYLVGLLVMLGMLGTFLGMVVTFRGTVFALERSVDLEAMRSALAAPIRGLGLSFGASVAGVAASAMLGLMAAFARRERLEVGRKLDAHIAGALQPFSLVHQRLEGLRAAQVQARALPELVQRLDALMERIEQRSEQLDTRLAERHAALQGRLLAHHEQLAQELGSALRGQAQASARAAGEAIRPAVESTLSQLAQQAERLHARLGEAGERQVAAIAQRFEAGAEALASRFQAAIAATQASQAAGDDARLQAWTAALQACAQRLQADWQRSGEQAQARHAAMVAALEQAGAQFAERTAASAGRTLEQAEALLQRSEELVRSGGQAQARWEADYRSRMDQLLSAWREESAALRAAEVQRGEAATARLDELAARWREETTALREAEAERAQAAARRLDQLLASWRSESTALREAEAQRGEAAIARLDGLLAAWREESAALREAEAQRGAAAVARLGELEAAVADHLARLGAALEEPLQRLLQTASEVPQAAAGVITQLREEMGRIAERDNLALQERNELLARLRELMDAVQTAGARQRAATEDLLGATGRILEQAGQRFAAVVDAQASKAEDAAGQIAAGALELSAVAEAFLQGVAQFQAGNDKLVEGLERMEASLRRSTARSDEQLAYYVAQAREVIDLSIASQQGLLESLRGLQALPVRSLPPEKERA